MHDPNGKILITGTGRCGTTFLVQLLTELGFDTGFRFLEGQWQRRGFQRARMDAFGHVLSVHRSLTGPFTPAYDSAMEAGLEWSVSPTDSRAALDALPKVIKDPRLCWMLGDLLRDGRLTVNTVLVPVRDLREVAQSRGVGGTDGRRVRRRTRTGLDLLHDSACQLGELISTLVTFDVAFRLLPFPRIATDGEFCYESLRDLLGPREKSEFMERFSRVAREERIHWSVTASSSRQKAHFASHSAET